MTQTFSPATAPEVTQFPDTTQLLALVAPPPAGEPYAPRHADPDPDAYASGRPGYVGRRRAPDGTE